MKEDMKKIVHYLEDRKRTIATMESCTGGAICHAITNIEGASRVFQYSAITYSNDFKIRMGVSKEIIDTYSVYSFETADAMSKTIATFANSDFGVGITGMLNRVDEKNKSEKTNRVYISIYSREKETFFHKEVEVHSLDRPTNKNTVLRHFLHLFLNEIIK